MTRLRFGIGIFLLIGACADDASTSSSSGSSSGSTGGNATSSTASAGGAAATSSASSASTGGSGGGSDLPDLLGVYSDSFVALNQTVAAASGRNIAIENQREVWGTNFANADE